MLLFVFAAHRLRHVLIEETIQVFVFKTRDLTRPFSLAPDLLRDSFINLLNLIYLTQISLLIFFLSFIFSLLLLLLLLLAALFRGLLPINAVRVVQGQS